MNDHQPPEPNLLNPVIIWDSGKVYDLPIGITQTPDGEYAVFIDPPVQIRVDLPSTGQP